MKIQIGVNQKMKLYNVYRICKQNIDFFKQPNITKNVKESFTIEQTQITHSMKNWAEFKDKLKSIRKLPILKDLVDNYYNTIPVFIQDQETPRLSSSTVAQLNSIKKNICDKMETVINLYEGMNLGDSGNGIDIKMPPCDDLKDYISYLKDIEFIFSQCPFLQCENEILKFDSVDIGSNWLRLTIAAASTCMILNNTAALVDKALILRSHYISIKQQEETLKSIQINNELSKEQIETFTLLRNTYMDATISVLENDLGKLNDPEERDKAKRALEKLIDLLDKGCEIYATLDSPAEVQALFPEIQSNLELPDNIIKYIEDKEHD